MISLLDVNVLVALLDPVHVLHEAAHRWIAAHGREGSASCPITINGCVRVLSNPSYPAGRYTPVEIINLLRVACSTSDHDFWPDDVSLLNEQLFRASYLTGPHQITDAYLLGLAVRHGGRLATFDQTINLKIVVGAEPRHLVLLRSG